MTFRKVTKQPILQGTDERIAYTLTTTPWGSAPANPVVVIKDHTGADTSLVNLSGAPSVLGDVITTPLVIDLTPGETYRLEILFVISGNTFEAWAELRGEL